MSTAYAGKNINVIQLLFLRNLIHHLILCRYWCKLQEKEHSEEKQELQQVVVMKLMKVA